MAIISCPRCGVPLMSSAKHCRACGAPTQPDEAQIGGAMVEEAELATAGSRLLAQLLNGVILLPVLGIAMLFGFNPDADMEAGELPFSGVGLTLVVVLFLAYAGLQIYLLATRGQDVGKMAMNIKIVKVDTGLNGGIVPNFLLRQLVNSLIGGIPFVGPMYAIVDILFIFRGDRRCIHDHLAGTRVVKA